MTMVGEGERRCGSGVGVRVRGRSEGRREKRGEGGTKVSEGE